LFIRHWDAMRENTEWIVQFHPLIPVEKERFVAEKLKSEYIELQDTGHFIVE
jgi:hypothetical protein